VDRQGNETAMGWTMKHPHGWTDDWYGDFKVLRTFKQTHVGNCKYMTTKRRREREKWKNECQTFWNINNSSGVKLESTLPH